MYGKILVGLDGSQCSDYAGQASLALAKSFGSELVACHVYAAEMHRTRFTEMEIGLPRRYQEPERLEHLRDTHDDIIGGGMKIISDAFLAPFIAKANDMQLKVIPRTPEGRNYVQFVKIMREMSADLVVVGAEGLGKVTESPLGSFAERSILHGAGSDIIVARRDWDGSRGPIVVGVDGSEHSYSALRKGAEIGRLMGREVRAVAVYDPFFHVGVFSSISGALTKEQASRFNFAAQQKLHDEIIDDGLKALYEKRIAKGIERLGASGPTVAKEVLTGKVFSQLSHYASVVGASLVVVGRYGVHKEDISLIGSTAHALARSCPTNLLIVDTGVGLDANRMIQPENQTSSIADASTAPSASAQIPAGGWKEADTVTLKKAKRLAPSFHEHIVKGRIIGAEVEAGTRYMVYDVVSTEPSGRVKVTERTRLEFI